MKTYIATPHQNRLDEMVLMRGHNICTCIHGAIRKIIPITLSYLDHCCNNESVEGIHKLNVLYLFHFKN